MAQLQQKIDELTKATEQIEKRMASDEAEWR